MAFSIVVDLTARMAADGRLTWDAPDGDWTIVRVGYAPNGQVNEPAAFGGGGLECDKLSKDAVQAHWDGMMGKLIEELGPLAGTTLHNVLMDSYERGTQNWTPGFEKEFRRRCGYDLRPFLPVLFDRIVDSPEVSERFLWDFRRTIADLFGENYSGQFARMAHEHGMLYSVEPYGNCPADDLQYGSYADVPMSEFWVGWGGAGNAKLAASLGHVYGRRLVGAEAFTASTEHGKWLKDPYSLKALGDLVFCDGVNRLIFHRYAHQPWLDRFPGMTMGPWGTNLERTVTWWEQSRAWMKYLARCQFLLQSGRFVADVCRVCGEGAPNDFPANDSPQGYDYDACRAAMLGQMTVSDGRLRLPSGMSYRVLVLPRDGTMTPEMLVQVKRLAESGAIVVGPRPSRSPSLSNYPRCDAETRRMAEELWRDRIVDTSAAKALAALGVKPDFQAQSVLPADRANDPSGIHYIHRVAEGADIYFVANQEPEQVEVACRFRIADTQPEFWHPDTGVIEPAPVFTARDGQTRVPLRLDPCGSMFVVFRRPAVADHAVAVRYAPLGGSSASQRQPTSELVVLKAEYGYLEVGGQRADVTRKLASLVKDGVLRVCADNRLVDHDPAPNIAKTLRVEYRCGEVAQTATVDEGQVLCLPDSVVAPPAVELTAGDGGGLTALAWQPVSVRVQTVAGKTLSAEALEVSSPITISGPWELSFPPHWGAPDHVELAKLISWTEHDDPGVKYFSGTAIYRKVFEAPKLGQRSRLFLDLGKVQNLAEIELNGHDLGVLWKPPFRVEITDAVRFGQNALKVRVTNLWPNRLIGDAELPEDCLWNVNHHNPYWKGSPLTEWPCWLLQNKPSPTGRLTFTTWRLWQKGDALLPSGLFGPVLLRTAVSFQVCE
jgi:hypothetical protein